MQLHLARMLAIALGLGLAGPALAQQAGDAADGPAMASRIVAPRDLMTPEERAAFRAQMQRATPEERQSLWQQKHSELAQRASARGVTMAEPGRGLGQGERSSRRDEGRGGREGGRPGRMTGPGPRGA